MNVNLTDLHAALQRIRSGATLAPADDGRPRGRALAALLYFGRLRAAGELGSWPRGNRWPTWRGPGGSRRAAFTGAIEDLFTFPADKLIDDRQGLSLQPSASFRGASTNMPSSVAIDPFAGYLASAGMLESAVLFWAARGETRGRVVMRLDDGRWPWAGAGAARQSPLEMKEFNPANTIEAQQGFQCYYPVEGLTRAAALTALGIARPDCEYWHGERGRGKCRASAAGGANSENCQGAEGKLNVYWPRALLTQVGRDAPWAVAPEGFTMIRDYARCADLDGLRADLSIVAGTCESLRSGQDFSSGSVVIDPGWLGRQIDVEAWDALRI